MYLANAQAYQRKSYQAWQTAHGSLGTFTQAAKVAIGRVLADSRIPIAHSPTHERKTVRLLRYGPPGKERPALLVSDTAAVDISGVAGDITEDVLAADGPAELQRLDVSRRRRFDVRSVRVAAPIGKPGKIVCVGMNYRAHARAVIAGCTISNDVSERTAQLDRGGQWVKGKSLPTFNPLGPWLVTADEVGDPTDLNVLLTVNGVPRQNEPGDVVNTGTPAGVALGHDGDDFYLRDGDQVVAVITGLGEHRNRVVDARAAGTRPLHTGSPL